jgi:hypothetical protein
MKRNMEFFTTHGLSSAGACRPMQLRALAEPEEHADSASDAEDGLERF